MTTATILKKINALPMEERMMIVERVIRTIRLEKRKNPENPSPSGDPWFDDPRNIAIVMEGIESGDSDLIFESENDIKNYFANL